ncbi:hypothetical protein ACEPAI_1457 [Sanghuangporus weigelae]
MNSNEKPFNDGNEVSVTESERDVSDQTTGGQNLHHDDHSRRGTLKLDDNDHTRPTGFRLLLLTIGLSLVVFTVALEDTIVATAIPRITTAFNSLNDVGWYGSAFLLTATSLQPLFGKVYTYFDVKWVYLSALVVFEVGSIICAAATSSAMLIIGRAVAGVGASALFSGSLTIIGFSVPLSKMAFYIAVLTSMYGIASVIGPVLGGALTDKLSWRWCFWINLPFGAVAFFAVMLLFTTPHREDSNLPFRRKLQKMDIPGAIFFISAIICLLLALQQGGTTYPWGDSRIWGLFLGFGLIIIVFIVIQYIRGNEATLPRRVVMQRSVLAGSLYTILFSMAFFTHIFFLPFYFQAVKGTTAEKSGICSIPYLVSVSLASVISAGAIIKVGYYSPFMWAGAAIFSVGSGLLFTLQTSSSTGVWIGYQVVAAAGYGLGMQVPFLAIQAVLSASDMPTGNAIILFCTTFGGSISISVAETIFTNTLINQVPKHSQGVDGHVIASSGATTLRQIIPSDQLQGVLEAYMYALQRTFILPIVASALSFIISLFMEWRSVKRIASRASPTT